MKGRSATTDSEAPAHLAPAPPCTSKREVAVRARIQLSETGPLLLIRVITKENSVFVLKRQTHGRSSRQRVVGDATLRHHAKEDPGERLLKMLLLLKLELLLALEG